MPKVNPDILRWARETAGLDVADVARSIGLRAARGLSPEERLLAMESGEEQPTRSVLLRMSKKYRRPLVAFYLAQIPPKGNRGSDFRLVPILSETNEALLDALIRDIRARQEMLRSIVQDDEDATRVKLSGSLGQEMAVGEAADKLRSLLNVTLEEYRRQKKDSAFTYLRGRCESQGLFVMLVGDLGSWHSAIEPESFRGYAIADDYAPLVVINAGDARASRPFTLIHELAHICLGQSGISGGRLLEGVEKFCNDVASEFLLPEKELLALDLPPAIDLEEVVSLVDRVVEGRNLSHSMVAYRLMSSGIISRQNWERASSYYLSLWRDAKEERVRRSREKEGGPRWYVVKRYSVGAAMLSLVSSLTSTGELSASRASRLLGVKPQQVYRLLYGAG